MARTRSHRPAAPSPEGGRITAVLGPTNTGKTHFAIERMLAHRSAMIGLPLRLLAREVYDKVVRVKGAADAALITGEEKIVPPHARYFVCTVEAMPLDLAVAFLAVDEIQLCADAERGHVFTDRLLHARGEEETMFLGAATIRGLIQRFVPRTQFITRPRFSDLAYTGPRKITRLPRRSAVVCFSAEDVYSLADVVRQQRGGAAVVLGALSPRTRNAQVALYQSGDVDFLVATDAIGMGLNMDVDHVAFAGLDKFDGAVVRPLKSDEIGQIAGRAGRFMNDGTFGTTAGIEGLDDAIAIQVENHRYDPVRVLQWRNAALSFASLDALLGSLDEPPPMRGLAKARPASDLGTLRWLAADEDIRARAGAPAAVKLLWQACQLPDFRKLTPDDHTRLVAAIYRHLMSAEGRIPEDWLARQIARLDTTEGELDTLSGRLAQIRTWTYAAHRPGWIADAQHWQGVTRAVEDRLSDALHERLSQRFVDRRTAILMRSLREDEALTLVLDDSGGVSLGGETVGKLDGFRFAPDPRAEGIHGRTLRAAALKSLEGEIAARAGRLVRAEDSEFLLSEHAKIWWSGAAVAHLAAGAHPLSPRVALLDGDLLKTISRDAVQARLDAFVAARIAGLLAPLIALRDAQLPAAARGIAFQLLEKLGGLNRIDATLPRDLRAAASALRPYGVRFGWRSIFLPKLLKPEAAALKALLWAVHARLEHIPSPPTSGATSIAVDGDMPPAFLGAAGFRVVGPRAVRLDILERVCDGLAEAEKAARDAATASRALVSLLGCSNAEFAAIAEALGWRAVANGKTQDADVKTMWGSKRRDQRKPRGRRAQPSAAAGPDSPFAGLAQLIATD